MKAAVPMHRGKPRYVVATVTGYNLNPAGTRTNNRMMTSTSVLDRAYCHRILAQFDATMGRSSQVCAERAAEVLEALNSGTPVPWWDGKDGKRRFGP